MPAMISSPIQTGQDLSGKILPNNAGIAMFEFD
jgi:hypothetical protein